MHLYRSGRVRQVQADLTHLPFETGHFGAAFSHQQFQHVRHPKILLTEMVRVTRPGGWLVVLDADWASVSVDAPDLDVERRLMGFQARRVVGNATAGRQFHRLLNRAGLVDVCVTAVPLMVTSYPVARQQLRLDEGEDAALDAGVVTEGELGHWRTALAEADDDGLFFATVTMVVARGRVV